VAQFNHALILKEIVSKFPEKYRAAQHRDLPRMLFHMQLLSEKLAPDAVICDVGGGRTPFTAACAAAGAKAHLVDDYLDDVNEQFDDLSLDVHRGYGVHVQRLDILRESLPFAAESVDAFTSFDCLEHLHHSPKKLLHSMVSMLKPTGALILAFPNCVNLRKRISTLLGTYRWTQMHDWYDTPVFRGHVREPNVHDLHYIANDLGLRNVCIWGRNWSGYYSDHKMIRVITPLFDHLLRIRPGLCSDIYMVGTK
jgi:SAM-dependent methyltransferase